MLAMNHPISSWILPVWYTKHTMLPRPYTLDFHITALCSSRTHAELTEVVLHNKHYQYVNHWWTDPGYARRIARYLLTIADDPAFTVPGHKIKVLCLNLLVGYAPRLDLARVGKVNRRDGIRSIRCLLKMADHVGDDIVRLFALLHSANLLELHCVKQLLAFLPADDARLLPILKLTNTSLTQCTDGVLPGRSNDERYAVLSPYLEKIANPTVVHIARELGVDLGEFLQGLTVKPSLVQLPPELCLPSV